MATAFVLLNVEIGEEPSMIEKIKKLEHVEEVNAVYGVYDIIVKCTLPSDDKLHDFVLKKIHMMENVRSSMTMICIK